MGCPTWSRSRSAPSPIRAFCPRGCRSTALAATRGRCCPSSTSSTSTERSSRAEAVRDRRAEPLLGDLLDDRPVRGHEVQELDLLETIEVRADVSTDLLEPWSADERRAEPHRAHHEATEERAAFEVG